MIRIMLVIELVLLINFVFAEGIIRISVDRSYHKHLTFYPSLPNSNDNVRYADVFVHNLMELVPGKIIKQH